VIGDGQDEIEEEYGKMSSTSVGTIIRKIVALEQQGAEVFFGEKSFDPEDLLRMDDNGKGVISILNSTFPEEGDAGRPKLALFIDEAHLVFNEASDVLLNQIETIVKLIRSKGVGIFFITQNPADVPESVLGQLGLKIQHALRAFTAKDRKAIKLAAQNYPLSDHYDVEELLTSLGIGEAFMTGLDEKGIPTPLAHTYLRAPMSRMDVLSQAEINEIISKSALTAKYSEEIDRESAYEILTRKMDAMQAEELRLQEEKERAKEAKSRSRSSSSSRKSGGGLGKVVKSDLFAKGTKALLGTIGVKATQTDIKRVFRSLF